MLPQLESIPGYDLQDFDRSTELLRRIYNKINRSIRFLRDESGLSQREFANFFAIPVVPCKLGIKEVVVAQYIFIFMRSKLGWEPIENLFGVKKQIDEANTAIHYI